MMMVPSDCIPIIDTITKYRVTNTLFCDFIVWTPKSLERIVIEYDQQLWEDVHPKLMKFYIEYMLPLVTVT